MREHCFPHPREKHVEALLLTLAARAGCVDERGAPRGAVADLGGHRILHDDDPLTDHLRHAGRDRVGERPGQREVDRRDRARPLLGSNAHSEVRMRIQKLPDRSLLLHSQRAHDALPVSASIEAESNRNAPRMPGSFTAGSRTPRSTRRATSRVVTPNAAATSRVVIKPKLCTRLTMDDCATNVQRIRIVACRELRLSLDA